MDGQKFYWAPLIAFAMGALGLVSSSPLLETQRPPRGPDVVAEPVGADFVDARLWDDPFVALGKDDHKEEAASKLVVPGAGKLLILVIHASGGHSADDSENRIRSRHALMAALNMAGNAPSDAEHIVHFHLEGFGSVPIEFFGRNSMRNTPPIHAKVVVCWLNDHLLQDNPLAHYEALRAAFETAAPKRERTLRIVGPTTSTGLADILKNDEPGAYTKLTGVAIYSPWATMSDADLAKLAGKPVKLNLECGAEIHRTIGTDEQLVKALLSELRVRRESPADSHVAIICEWDTHYGRALSSAFVEGAHDVAGAHDDTEHVHTFRYLRGIDGHLVRDKERGAREATAPENHAFGPSQLDYVRRLRHQLEMGGHEYRAIGILGSDVYDKLLLLRALRGSFRNAVFFTTDLDARLLDPEERKYTRNVLVASHYGLQLGEKLQGGVFPFRGSYQVSLYVALLRALDYPDLPDTAVTPRMYEIARNGPYDLSMMPGDDYHPDSPRLEHGILGHDLWRWTAAATLCLALLLFFLFTVLASPHAPWRDRVLRNTMVLITIGLTGLYLVATLTWWSRDPEGEPFALFEGISAWPSAIARVPICCLCLFFFIKVVRDLRCSANEIRTEYFSDLRDEAAGILTGLETYWNEKKGTWTQKMGGSPTALMKTWRWGRLAGGWGLRKRISICRWTYPKNDLKADEVWSDYMELGYWPVRAARLVPAFAAIVVLAFCLLQLGEWPIRPVRGVRGSIPVMVTLFVSIGATFLVTLLVLDATALCGRLVHHLEHAKMWPDALVQKIADKRGVSKSAARSSLVIRVIAKHTDAVGRAIYVPFILLFLMLAVHTSFFDNFHVPITVWLLLFLTFGGVWLASALLRHSARTKRDLVLDELERNARSAAANGKDDKSKALRVLASELKEIKHGAYGALLGHPILRSLLIPFGGLGGLQLLEVLGRHL